ncbi:hypothetical protein ACV3Q3_12940 [Clostridium perfringens]|nr:hypothetical protein [Clostridium perfringens]
MFLYKVSVVDGYETDRFLVVASNDKEAKKKVLNMCNWGNDITVLTEKIDMVENYIIRLEETKDNKNLGIIDLF